MNCLFRNEFPIEGRTAIVTGGSEGMGKAVSCQLAERGANVVIVARTVQKLQDSLVGLKASARSPGSQKFHYISADLTKSADCERVVKETTEWNNGNAPDIAWCCAGYCTPGFFMDMSTDALRSQMDTVYWTAANMAHAVLQQWLVTIPPSQQSPGPGRHLIFTCSTLAFAPIAGYAPYSPAKAAMRSLSDTLSQELEIYNGARTFKTRNSAPAADIKVHTVFPMGILSPGFDNEEKMKPELTKKLEEADKPQTPTEVASISIKALERGEYLITTTLLGHLMKASALGVSPRNAVVSDTLTSWASNLAFARVIPDLRKKAREWGRKYGMPKSHSPGQ